MQIRITLLLLAGTVCFLYADAKPIIDNSNCSPVAIAAENNATSNYQKFLKDSVAKLTPFDKTITDQPEQVLFVDNVNGINTVSSILSIKTDGEEPEIYKTTVISLHTHPFGEDESPTAADVFGLGESYPAFKQEYIIGNAGDKYCISIDDLRKLQAFVIANPGAVYQTSGKFNEAKPLGITFAHMETALKNSGFNAAEAYERALAFVFKDAGITITKAVAGSNNFKTINITQKLNADSSVAKDAAGNVIYTKADCP